MICIYCKTPSDAAQGLAHVFPEAVVRNPHTLPRGTVCDRCNNYFGTTLDGMLPEHPIIALAVQMLGLPGKKGAARHRVGAVGRDKRGRYIVIPCEAPVTSYDRYGRRSDQVSVNPSHQYDDPRFARALHHVALNSLAFKVGLEAALQSQYDEVRRYIRSPHKGEKWPYGAYSPGLDPIRKLVQVESVSHAPGTTSRITIFNLDFYVDLENTGKLGDWVSANLPREARFGQAIPKTPKLGMRQYRIKIYLVRIRKRRFCDHTLRPWEA